MFHSHQPPSSRILRYSCRGDSAARGRQFRYGMLCHSRITPAEATVYQPNDFDLAGRSRANGMPSLRSLSSDSRRRSRRLYTLLVPGSGRSWPHF